MILLISHEQDDHAPAVRDQLRGLGANVRLLDLADFPVRMGLDIAYEGGRATAVLHAPDGPIALSEVGAAWWRRPQQFTLDPAMRDPRHQSFALTECHSAMQGLWALLDCHWVNDPTRDDIGARKPYQLRVAREAGLETPRTLISSHPPSVRAFVEELGAGNVIYKSFYASFDAWRETRRLRGDEVAMLDATRYAPVIFQQYIPARLDLRITVIGDRIFASAVHSQQAAYEVDYRMELDSVRVEPHELPDAVRAALLRFMRRLGLVYGAIDMRLTPDGRYVFLEVNTSGQWLFMEEKTGQPITRAFADHLIAADTATGVGERAA